MEQAHCNLQTKHHMKSNVNIVIFCVLSFNRTTEKGNLQTYQQTNIFYLPKNSTEEVQLIFEGRFYGF